jgi:hypothetical protein
MFQLPLPCNAGVTIYATSMSVCHVGGLHRKGTITTEAPLAEKIILFEVKPKFPNSGLLTPFVYGTHFLYARQKAALLGCRPTIVSLSFVTKASFYYLFFV